MRSFSEKFAGLIGPSLLALIYLMTFPLTVQTGDTGELVTNAFFLRVSHPTGYPLYTLLYHLPEKFLTWLSPFGTAGFVTVILSLIWIGILLRTCKTLEQKLSFIVLGTTMLVWRYAVLPDVFALHLLFLVLVYTVFQEPSLLKRPWIIFLIALGLTAFWRRDGILLALLPL